MITVIGNLKGGTGKSTVTFNLAVWLRTAGVGVTVIDLDPQRTLTDVAALRQEENIEPPIQVHSGPLPSVSLLRSADETLIDVGTADLESFKQALTIADRILIPVTPSQADIWSTQRFVRFLDKTTDGSPPESLTFINRADINRAVPNTDEAAAALTSLPGVRLIPQRLHDRTMFRNSFSEGLAVFELEPRSSGSREFKALATALFGQERPRKQAAPWRAASIERHALEALPVDQTVMDSVEYEEEMAVAVPEHEQDWQRMVEAKAKKQGTREDRGAFEGKKHKKHKKHKKGMKEKGIKKGGKHKKDKKLGKGKASKKDKKAKKSKKSKKG